MGSEESRKKPLQSPRQFKNSTTWNERMRSLRQFTELVPAAEMTESILSTKADNWL